MSGNPDRLYDLVPVVYRLRDAEQGYRLRALLHVIAEQVNLVEDDIAQLYEDWFIETCQDWVVPYIGDLVGYRPVYTAGQPGDAATRGGEARNEIMIRRREVANTVRFRRRKGTLGIIDDLATAVSGWPAHATEFYRLLAVTQNINHLRLDRGRTAALRNRDVLDDLNGAFNSMARNVDVRRVNSRHFPGGGNIGELGVYVWRLKTCTVTRTPAHCHEEQSPNCFLFSVLGNDTPLYVNPEATVPPAPLDLILPTPIARRRFEARGSGESGAKAKSGVPFYYGDGKSLMIWTGTPPKPYPAEQVIPADLSDWSYRPLPNQVAVDPELGRFMFAPGQTHKRAVSVSYCYGFSADIGGGEYDRTISQPAHAKIYRVGANEEHKRIGDALATWKKERPTDAVIEINGGVYTEPISIELDAGQSLQLRAANRTRPVLRMLDWQASFPDSLSVSTVDGAKGCWFVLDGIILTGRGIQVGGGVSGVRISHSTLVPGWGLECNCNPKRPAEPSVELINAPLCLSIEHSIVGSIQVERNEVCKDPMQIRVSDSIVDATSRERVALGASGQRCAFATLVITRSTVIGELQTHAIELAENSILLGSVLACRSQQGCMRFCYVPPGSRTPKRYECQPDLVGKAVADLFAKGAITPDERDTMMQSEQLRVEPDFNSTRYGNPTYCQLADTCAAEISGGADDESEMGVFHDLYQPQRIANLRARLDEYTPAGINAGVILAS